MKKERIDGLFMDNSIYIFDEKKPGFPVYSRIIQLLAIIIGSWSAIGLLMETIAVPADYLKVNLAILLCSILVYILCIIPTLDLVKLFFGFLFYGLFFYSRLPVLCNGFYIIENLILDRVTSYYEFHAIRFVADYTTASVDLTLFMIMIILPVVSLLTVAVIRNRYVNLIGVILFLPVTVSFSFGLIPSERYLIAYLVAVLYLSRSSYRAHKRNDRAQKIMLHRINSSAAVWLSIICISIFFLLKLLITEEKYYTISEIKDTKKEIQTAMYNVSWEDLTKNLSEIALFPNQRATGGLNGGQLGKVGDVDYSESEQLRVTARKGAISQGFYLKGYVGSVYTIDSWEGHSKKMEKAYQDLLEEQPEEYLPINQLSMFVENINRGNRLSPRALEQMSIEYEDANKNFIYLPYMTDYYRLENMNYIQDLYAAPKKKKNSYTLDYYNFILNNTSENSRYFYLIRINSYQESVYFDQDLRYQDFVHQAYTTLPEEGLERLKEEFSSVIPNISQSLGIITYMSEFPKGSNANWIYLTIVSKIDYITDYLNQNTTYSLSPGKLPKGEDFVEYFLYQSKKGYCSHYATAATLMLRAMGVPARYVEGYAVSPSDIKQNTLNQSKKDSSDRNDENTEIEVSVKDYNAHAWTEVYFDGIGWIPVDFTPSSAIGYLALEGDNRDNEQAAPTRAPYNQSQNDMISDTPKQLTPKPVKPMTNPAKNDKIPGNGDTTAEKKRMDTLFFRVFIALIIVGFSSTIILIIINNKKIQKKENHNRRAIVLFIKIEKILATCHELGKRGAHLEDCEEYVKEHCVYLDKIAFASCMEIVRKARFGRGGITQEELDQIEILRFNLFERAYKEQSFLRKLYLKFLFSVSFT